MGILNWLFNRTPTSTPAPQPTPAPVTPPTAEPSPVPSGTLIRIEGHNGIRWREYFGPLPFSIMGQAKVGTSQKIWKKARVTVLSGPPLTIKSFSYRGKHHPTITGVTRNQVIHAGSSVIIEFWLGPAEPGKGGYEWTYFGVKTVERGEIIIASAQVMY